MPNEVRADFCLLGIQLHSRPWLSVHLIPALLNAVLLNNQVERSEQTGVYSYTHIVCLRAKLEL